MRIKSTFFSIAALKIKFLAVLFTAIGLFQLNSAQAADKRVNTWGNGWGIYTPIAIESPGYYKINGPFSGCITAGLEQITPGDGGYFVVISAANSSSAQALNYSNFSLRLGSSVCTDLGNGSDVMADVSQSSYTEPATGVYIHVWNFSSAMATSYPSITYRYAGDGSNWVYLRAAFWCDSNNPTIIPDKTSLSFDGANATQTFTVVGAFLTNDVTLSAPSGITLDKTSITQLDATTGLVTVTATWDGVASISDNITLTTTGGITKTIQVTSTAAPVIVPSVTSLLLEDIVLKDSITVSSANLTSDMTITAPAGITVNPTTITAPGASNVKVYVIYDGTTTVNDSIVFTSGTLVKKMGIRAASNAGCFAPLYPTATNLVSDPYMNDISNFGVMNFGGDVSINTNPAYVYCGIHSGKVSGLNGGVLYSDLAGKLSANTVYRVKAKVYAIGGVFQIGVTDIGTPEVTQKTTTTDSWEDIDFELTTGASIGTKPFVFFNNYNLGGVTGYIDNWEMYAVPKVYTSVSSLNIWGTGKSQKVAVRGVNLTQDITITSPTGFSVAPSTLLSTVAGDSVAIEFNSLTSASGYVYFTSGTIKDSALVTGIVNPALYAIDFANENTNGVVPATDEYSANADMSSAVAGTGTNVALIPGQNLYYRIMSTGVFPASATQTLTVPARPATPAYSIDFVNEKTTQVVAATNEYSASANMSGATSGTGATVAVTPGQNLYFRVKATSSAFKSDAQTLAVVARPAAPTSPVEDDNANTFDWTNNSLFNSIADYEFSIDSAKIWATATAKPINVGNVDLSVGAVLVRVKASTSNSNFSSLALMSTAKYTLSTGISVASFGKVTLYPNPVSDNLIIQVDGAKAGIADIFDFSGKKLATVKLNSNVTIIDMSGYNAGSYLVKIITAKGISFKSIIKR